MDAAGKFCGFLESGVVDDFGGVENDEVGIRGMIEQYLTREGYEVVTAATLGEARKALVETDLTPNPSRLPRWRGCTPLLRFCHTRL